MSRPVWLEVALNGPWPRAYQPRVPLSVEEIVAEGIACVKAGAAIVHVHARSPASGRQKDDPDTYAAIIEGIRAEVDAIVYPTLPFAGSPDVSLAGNGAERYAHVRRLGERGLLEWSVVDPGSVNLLLQDDLDRGREGFVYQNPEPHIRTGLALAQEFGFHPGFAIYEPGFLRMGAALAKAYPRAPQAIYRFMFSDGFLFGFPPVEYGLDAYLKLLAEAVPGAPWMVAGLSVDIRPLIPLAVAGGGHVRVGLEDAPQGCEQSNVELTEKAVRLIAAAGGRSATPDEVRAELRGSAAG